jgi:hypothetical protein
VSLVSGRLILVAILLGAIGCQNLGPQTLAEGRPAYNTAVQRTSNEEMLLNIVRLRYRDTPFFLKVSAIAANVSAEVGLGGGAQFPNMAPNVGSISGTAKYRDNPTVTYAPLQGDAFVKQLLTPVRLETLLLLIDSGWSIDRVLRLCVQRLNGVRNAPSASGPTPELAPTYEEFARVAALFRALQQRDAIYFTVSHRAPRGLTVRFRKGESDSQEALELATRLSLKAGARRFTFTNQVDVSSDSELIGIETRSLMGSLFYLSQAVAPPERHESNAWVTVTRNHDGSRFEWNQMMGDFFRITSTKLSRSNAFLSTDYLGASFSIDHADLNTKATFALLDQLFALQAGTASGAGPVLTLPISR